MFQMKIFQYLGIVFLILIFALFSGMEIGTGSASNLLLLFAGIISFLLIFNKPVAGIYIIFYVAILYNPSLRVGFFAVYLSNALIVLIFTAILIKILLIKDYRVAIPLHSGVLFFYIIIAIVTLFQVGDLTLGVKRIMAILIFTGGYFITAELVRSEADLRKFIDIIINSASLGSLFGIYQFIFVSFRGIESRAYAALNNPNHLANYLLLIIPLTITMYTIEPKGRKKRKLLLFTVLQILCLLATKSRGGLLASGVTLMMISITSRRKMIVFVLIALTLMTLIFAPSLYNRLEEGASSSTNKARVTIWKNALGTFASNPLFGIGVGNFMSDALPYDSKIFNGAFNIILTTMAELGIAGTIVFLVFFYRIFKMIIFIYNYAKVNIKQDFLHTISFGLFLSFIAFMLHCMVDDVFFSIINNWLFGMLLGLVNYIYRTIKSHSAEESIRIEKELRPAEQY